LQPTVLVASRRLAYPADCSLEREREREREEGREERGEGARGERDTNY